MKYIILISILFTYILSANDTLPDLNKQIIKSSFSFTGKARIDREKSVCDFKGKTSSTTFECSWVKSGVKGSVKIHGDKGVIKTNNKTEETTAELALIDALVLSRGSALFMHDIWKGDTSSFFPNENIKVSKNNGLTTVTGELRERSLKVILKDGIVLSIESVSDPKKLAKHMLEYTEDDIIEMLKADNKEVTEKTISEQKQFLENTWKIMLEAKEKIKMKIEINITTP